MPSAMNSATQNKNQINLSSIKIYHYYNFFRGFKVCRVPIWSQLWSNSVSSWVFATNLLKCETKIVQSAFLQYLPLVLTQTANHCSYMPRFNSYHFFSSDGHTGSSATTGPTEELGGENKIIAISAPTAAVVCTLIIAVLVGYIYVAKLRNRRMENNANTFHRFVNKSTLFPWGTVQKVVICLSNVQKQ